MASIVRLLFLFVAVFVCVANAEEQYEPATFFKAFPKANKELAQRLAPEILEQLKNNNETYESPAAIVYSCPNIPAPAPTDSVFALKPGHIKVVMAMGDSITAAMSAKDTSVLKLREYRGISFSVGGDAGVTTMPNILKQFTAAAPIGISTGIGKRPDLSTNGLNGAESGDLNLDMLGQAQWLVAQLKANNKINIAEDWKHLTIWIGSNNLCDVCDNDERNNADDFEKQLFLALDYLRANVPRLFVSLLANLDITQIYNIKDGMCGMLHPVECPCAADSDAKVREATKQVNIEYQRRAATISAHYLSQNDKSFAVVVQPFLINSKVTDRTYLSPADCFHPSASSHQYASVALWNNMISPKAQKKDSWDPKAVPTCPTEDTLLYTN